MNDYRKQQPNVGDGERLFSLLGAGRVIAIDRVSYRLRMA
jgi:hypothetical protein